jgi:hypothetical protein
MQIRKLDYQDRNICQGLFMNQKYMGGHDISGFYRSPTANHDQNTQYYHNFCNAYLADLKNYVAFGAFENNEIVGIISAYKSIDEPSWYGTQIRSNDGRTVVRALLDQMIDHMESEGRLKFYTLWNVKNSRLLRRFAFNKRTNERYDYFDEYLVPEKHKCLYTQHWHVLFNRVLLPVETVVRCTFLKQKYREQLPIGGNI